MKHFNHDAKVILVIIAIRKLRKYKQLRLATELNIDRSSYSKLEQGKAILSPGKFNRIADVLQTNAITILIMANAIENIDFENTTTDESLTEFFNIFPNSVEDLNFTPQQLISIFVNMKRFYHKVQLKAKVI